MARRANQVGFVNCGEKFVSIYPPGTRLGGRFLMLNNGAGDAGNDAADDVPVQRAAVVGDQPLVAADVVEVGGGRPPARVTQPQSSTSL